MNMALFVAACLVAVPFAGCATPVRSPTAGAPGFSLRRVAAGGQKLACVVYAPEVPPRGKPPVILFLHGRGECGEDGWKHVRNSSIAQAVMAAPGRWPFIIVMPQKPDPDRQWEEYDAPVMAALRDVVAEYGADESRVYLTGLSQGGHGSWIFAANHPGVFAAVAPICGYLKLRGGGTEESPESLAAKIDSAGRVPIWCFHGDADPVVPVSESHRMIGAIRAARAGAEEQARLTTYPGVGHNAWDRAYEEPDLPEWLLGASRDAGRGNGAGGQRP